MPLANGRYTTYKVVAIPFSLDNPNLTPGSIDASAAGWTYLMASDVNIQQSMPISSVKLTTGTGQTPIRDMGDIEKKYTLNGPCLIQSEGFLYDNSSNTMCVPSFVMELLYGVSRKNQYLINSISELNYPAAPPGLYFNREKPMITGINLTLGDDGLNGSINYSGLHFGPAEGSGLWQTPARKSRWYDFYVDLYLTRGGAVTYIGPYKINADIRFDMQSIEMPYIGKAQFKKYVYNGSTMKWSVKAVFDNDRSWPTVTRQDGMYPDGSEFGPYFPQYINYTDPNSAETLVPVSPAKAFSTGIIMKARANYNTVPSDLRTRFEALFNNVLWQNGSGFSTMGYEVGSPAIIGDGTSQTAFGFINDVNINLKFPLSDFTISGEKVFS